MTISLEVVVSRLFEENCWIVWRTGEAGNEAGGTAASPGAGKTACVVVDPGFDAAKVLRVVEQRGLFVATILLTHGHADHIAGVRAVKTAFPDAPIVIGRHDAVMLSDPERNLSALGGMPVTSPPADDLVTEGDSRSFAGLTFEVLDIPGHSPGHVVYVCRDADPAVVLGGDVLFAGSIGRTDFPGGSLRQLLDGIRSKLFTLPESTRVYPGHGPATTIGEERRTNPYCGVRALPQFTEE
jgi:hydroxyacylglutathione hydrolase